MQLNDFITQHNIDDGHRGYFVRPTLQECYDDLLSGRLNRPGQMMAIYLFHHFATLGDRLKYAVSCVCNERQSVKNIPELYEELPCWKCCVDDSADDEELKTRLSSRIEKINALPLKIMNANAQQFCCWLDFAFKGNVLRVTSPISKCGCDTAVFDRLIDRLKDFTVNFDGVSSPENTPKCILQDIPCI